MVGNSNNESKTITHMMKNIRPGTVPVPLRSAQLPAVPEVLVDGLLTILDDEVRMIIWHEELTLIPVQGWDMRQWLTQIDATVCDQCSTRTTVKITLEPLNAYTICSVAKLHVKDCFTNRRKVIELPNSTTTCTLS